jgi:hypothetical protein
MLYISYDLIKNIKKKKYKYLNIPCVSIEILDIGILINDELLQYGEDKNINIDIKERPTVRYIYYDFFISSIYSSVESIKSVPMYQYKEFESKLVDFFTKNGFKVSYETPPTARYL